MGQTIDIRKLQERGQAMHRDTREVTQLLQNATAPQGQQRTEIIDALREPVQQATQFLQAARQFDVPGIPAGIGSTPST